MKKEKKILYITTALILIASISLILSGCGSDPAVIPSITPTSTPVPVITATPTPVPVNTATPSVRPDISSHFSSNAYYDTFTDPNTGLHSGKFLIQFLQKSSSNLLPVTEVSILAEDNPDFVFPGGVIIQDGINDISTDWITRATSSLFEWKGNTPLTKEFIYSFHVNYASAPNLPGTVKVNIGNGTLTVSDHGSNTLGYIIIPVVRHDNPGIIDIATPYPPNDDNIPE